MPCALIVYDNNGNTLTKTDSTGTTNYMWDFENRAGGPSKPGLLGWGSWGQEHNVLELVIKISGDLKLR
jgi:hypothetical protein